MRYHQIVKLNKVPITIAKEAFQDINLIHLLTRIQPVKIDKWEGIEPGMTARFRLWFLGWRIMEVQHSNLTETDSELEFFDDG